MLTRVSSQVLDFGASRDGVPLADRGRRIVVDSKGREVHEEPLAAAEPAVVPAAAAEPAA